MRIGILGSGLMGSKLGTIFARAGHEVVFSYARSNDKLKKLARDAQGNAYAGTPGEAAKDATALLLAVHWSRTDDVLKQAGDLSGKIILTCSLPMDAANTKLIIANTSSGAEELAKKVPKSRVVSAFNTIPSEVLFRVFAARHKKDRPSLAYCGDDDRGKTVAAELIGRCGLRSHRCRAFTNCTVYRTVRAARRPTCIRGARRAGIGVSVRAVLNKKIN